jgi:4-amino-4-deoxy-L-arabinose transferase-like glycosyltransferase
MISISTKSMSTAKLLSLIILIFGISAFMLLASIASTNPANLGPGGVTLWFLVLLVASSSGLALLLYLFKRQRPERTSLSRRQRLGVCIRQGLLLGGYITVILALSSLRQLDLRDALLLVILMILIEFYFKGKK